MAEFCKECYLKYLHTGESVRLKLSKYPDLCEGCGQLKPVVERVLPLPLFGFSFKRKKGRDAL